jgi:hypothetical protein
MVAPKAKLMKNNPRKSLKYPYSMPKNPPKSLKIATNPDKISGISKNPGKIPSDFQNPRNLVHYFWSDTPLAYD